MHAAAGCFDDADDDNDDDERTTSLPRSPLCTYLSDRPDGILVRGSPPAFIQIAQMQVGGMALILFLTHVR
ncbi:hypothetical protein ALC57_02536 [Trachymyrmex cornetzi]|uniref:Uncharacterized protein n=1 Tax=Trachymyrmex cornetzi TaxID=471704 RepID=A0A195EIL7_9HYME|nr:hypothetical protein ALC57_02536 [Trachymyrmex cornetzi]